MREQEELRLWSGPSVQHLTLLTPHLQLLHPKRALAQIHTELGDDAAFAWWVATQDASQAVASCLAVVGVDFLDVSDLFVRPSFRRQGLATRLLLAVEDSARAWGLEHIGLEVRASNDDALGLYRKLKFTEMRRRKNYYAEPPEDAIVLQKQVLSLADGPRATY